MRYLDLKITKFLLTLFLFISPLGGAEEECTFPLEVRQQALFQLDEWINLVTPLPVRTYPLLSPKSVETFKESILEFQLFSQKHNFFSCLNPIVGIVTEETSDIRLVEESLESLVKAEDLVFMEIAVGELLTKALAYRNLQKGMKMKIPCIVKGKALLVDYQVNEVLDLWQEMPAFGLIPLHREANPILLFRGSDFSLSSKKSWASLLSDLDISGTGFSAFHLARSDIHAWLKKALLFSGNPAKVMGFSLGGILSIYTTIFEKDLIAKKGSMAFSPPGVSQPISEKWKGVSSLLKVYINQGDLIPKVGILVPPAYVLFSKEHMMPIEAHTKLMTAEPSFSLAEIFIKQQPIQKKQNEK
jgi:hypothetical protein